MDSKKSILTSMVLSNKHIRHKWMALGEDHRGRAWLSQRYIRFGHPIDQLIRAIASGAGRISW